MLKEHLHETYWNIIIRRFLMAESWKDKQNFLKTQIRPLAFPIYS